MKKYLCLIAVLLTCGPFLPAGADSLWKDNGTNRSMFSDHKASAPGDLVTIIIVESSSAENRAATTAGKDASISMSPDTGVMQRLLPYIGAKGKDDFKGNGATSRGGNMQAKITVSVMNVRPNGLLELEGRQLIEINKEKQEIVVSGVVRTEDISPDNTVYSYYVAEAAIKYSGTGPVGEKQKPGVITRILNWVF